MGRIGLILLVLVASVRANDFAAQGLKRHLGDSAANIDVVVDPALNNGGEAFSIATDAGRTKITGSTPHMALCGAYHLIERAGWKFLAPDFAFYKGAATIEPASKSLDSKVDWPIHKKPALKFRKLYVEEGHSHNIENLKQLVDWMPKAGFNTFVCPTDYGAGGRVRWDNWRVELTPELQKRGITIEVGGHGYENFLSAKHEDGKLFEQHPQWFAKSENGKPQKGKHWVFCTSNAAAVEYLTNNFLAYVKDRPEIQIFDFWPPDGAKWCECAECKKLGTPPDRQAILLKQVTAKTKPVRPDLRLEIIAYSSYVLPPELQQVDFAALRSPAARP